MVDKGVDLFKDNAYEFQYCIDHYPKHQELIIKKR